MTDENNVNVEVLPGLSTEIGKEIAKQVLPSNLNTGMVNAGFAKNAVMIRSNENAVSDFKSKLDEEKQKRELLNQYIQTSLIRGTDYGSIEIKNKKTGHVTHSKETLFKPGAEKICSLLHLQPNFTIDHEIIKIAGNGIIAFVCNLVNRHTGNIESEGRGSCSLSEKYGDVNTATKIAEKRAQIDAVLRFAALSGVFAQDLEDFKNAEGVIEADEKGNIIHPNAKKQEQKVEIEHTCTFGKNAGVRWDTMNMESLKWYHDAIEKNITDPAKEQYKEKNIAAIAGIKEAMAKLNNAAPQKNQAPAEPAPQTKKFEFISGPQANRFVAICLSSKKDKKIYIPYLKEKYGIDDPNKIKPESYNEAIEWAKLPAENTQSSEPSDGGPSGDGLPY